MDNNNFLGKGWSFPPVLEENRGVKMVAYEDDIRESLYILLSTYPGERVHRYNYGCPIRDYVYEVMNPSIITRMRNDIEKAVTMFESRIVLESISFEESREKAILLIKLEYIIVQANKRSNMVYPFYLNEGTDI